MPITDSFLLLKDLTLNLDIAQDLDSALSVVIQTICQRYQWIYGEAWRLDPQTNLLANRTTFCNFESQPEADRLTAQLTQFEQLSRAFTFALGEGIPGRVWNSQQWEWHTDVSITPKNVFLRAEEAASFGLRAAFSIPLVADGCTLAVLLFFSSEALLEDLPLVEIIDAISIPVSRLVQRRQTEKHLRDSESLFRAFMDHSAAMVFMKDAQGCFTYVNQLLEQEFNLQPGEIIGKNDFYLAPEAVAKQVRENDAAVLAKNQHQALVEVVPTPDGVSRYWQVNKFPFIDQMGQKYVGGVAFDITALKQLEQRLTIEKLEQQRINESLRAATEAARAASQAKSSFLAMMSHEIRTPMNAMLGMTELLDGTDLDPQQQDFVDIIQTGGNTLLTVINDILDFSKVESNNLELEVGRFDLYECIEQVLTLFSNQAEEKGLSLTSVVEPIDLVIVPTCFKGDATRLRQVLSNLVSNSIKFTQVGGVSIQVKTSLAAGAEPDKGIAQSEYELQFLVKDTGIGIAKEKLPHLFQPFSQVDASMTRRYGGTGLGLAISKQLVELMGGEVSVVSEAGKGSVFRFSIRLMAYSEPCSNDFVSFQTNFDNKRLLVIDSDDTSRRSLTLQAQSWFLEVDVAGSAEVAIAHLLGSDKFDAIVINDPICDLESLELIARIRRFPHYLTVPLILLQARTSRLLKPSCLLEDDRTKRLQKPMRRSQFYNTLAQLLQPDEGAMQGDISKSSDVKKSTDGGCKNDINANLVADIRLGTLKPLRILLAEDIALNQKVALQMLSTFGYQADVATTGIEAVTALQQQPYDLVFMDIQMPEMDGLEATQTIRLASNIEQPYIVAMTAHAMQGDRANCLSAGMDDYVRKPIRRRDLATVLQQCPPRKSSEKAQLFEKTTLKIALPTATVSDLPILDTTIIESIDTNSLFLKEVCDSFLNDAPERINAIRTALDQADMLALEHTAHALKSLSGCIGAMSLFKLCQSVEIIGKSGHINPALPLLAQVVSEYEKVKLAVQAYQKTL
ncbi:MAG: response regulator [Phormidesmis sp.]